MQPDAGLRLLTTAEAAEYLRLKERKLYELIAERQLPCTKAAGKWLFSRADLDRWVIAGMVRPPGAAAAGAAADRWWQPRSATAMGAEREPCRARYPS